MLHRDNTYGTPEEDAFRRDFTVNALFYDIGTFAIIDYVGGLEDLDAQLIRCIGDPEVRFLEDPVRMLRAVVLAARLQFQIDEPILDAVATHRHEIARSARRDCSKSITRSSAPDMEQALRQLRATGLLKEITPELAAASDALWESAARLDRIVRGSRRHPNRLRTPSSQEPSCSPLAWQDAGSGIRPIRWNGASSWASCRSRAGTWSVFIRS